MQIPWSTLKKLNKSKNKIEELRRKISIAVMKSPTSSFNEASNIDLDWLDFNSESDIKFLNFYFKIQLRCI